jgi:F-type H+-transporting ATPase subunit b
MSSLGINLPGLIAQLVNFALLLVLLYLLLYKRVIRYLDERSNRIRESMERAEQIKEQAARTDEQVQARLEAGRREGEQLIAQASQMGERIKEEAREAARKETELQLARAREQMDVERQRGLDELRREFAGLAIMAAERVIKERLDPETHRRLIEEVLEEGGFRRNGGSE